MSFSGIPIAALDFYEDLENDNSKTFWSAHKEIYDQQVKAPLVALMAALEPEFGAAKLFRPYRDVRFSKDKTLYKTHQGAVIEAPGRAGHYVHIDAAGLFVAAGRWELSSEEVARYRMLVAEDRAGAQLDALLTGLERHGFEVRPPQLKRVPAGFAKDHPRAELLRYKAVTVAKHFGDPDWLPTARTKAEVAKAWRTMQPLCAWLDQLGGASAV